MNDPSINLSEEAVAICQVLLNHQRSLLRLPERPPFQQCMLTYGDVCEGAGLPLFIEPVSRCLWEIAEFCADNGWPPLNALVVNARTHEPGKATTTRRDAASPPGETRRNVAWIFLIIPI